MPWIPLLEVGLGGRFESGQVLVDNLKIDRVVGLLDDKSRI